MKLEGAEEQERVETIGVLAGQFVEGRGGGVSIRERADADVGRGRETIGRVAVMSVEDVLALRVDPRQCRHQLEGIAADPPAAAQGRLDREHVDSNPHA